MGNGRDGESNSLVVDEMGCILSEWGAFGVLVVRDVMGSIGRAGLWVGEELQAARDEVLCRST